VRIPDFEDLVEADEANGTNTALDALEALVDQDPREDDGRAALEPDEQEEYLRLGGKRLYTPEARAARQVEIAEQIRAGDVLEAIYHVDGRVEIVRTEGFMSDAGPRWVPRDSHFDVILANNREDQKAARDADSKARVSGWFS
jgi:hypothetical protein